MSRLDHVERYLNVGKSTAQDRPADALMLKFFRHNRELCEEALRGDQNQLDALIRREEVALSGVRAESDEIDIEAEIALRERSSETGPAPRHPSQRDDYLEPPPQSRRPFETNAPDPRFNVRSTL